MKNDPVVIIGAGPAGLAAAEAASAGGQPVLLIDENSGPGGQIWRGGPQRWNDRRAERLWKLLSARPHVNLLSGTRVIAPAGPGLLLIDGADGASTVRWQRLVLCTGARELLLPFPGWTLPGVTGAGGLQALIKGGLPVEGKRVLVAGSGPLLLAVAATVKRHGGRLVAVAEHRATKELARFAGRLALSHRGKLLQSFGLARELRGTPYLRGAGVIEARGEGHLDSVVLEHLGVRKEFDCDYFACGFGLVPALETAAMFRCGTVGSGEGRRLQVDVAQRTSVPGVWAAGESTGIGGVDKSLAEGRIAGLDAVGIAPGAADVAARTRALGFAGLLAESFAPAAQWRAMCTETTIVCRCEDVRANALAGHADWRSAKLQTRVGMGPCQGRVCGTACGFLYGWEAPELRQPVFPVSAGALASVGAPPSP